MSVVYIPGYPVRTFLWKVTPVYSSRYYRNGCAWLRFAWIYNKKVYTEKSQAFQAREIDLIEARLNMDKSMLQFKERYRWNWKLNKAERVGL